MDPIILYIIAKYGIPMLFQKTLTIEFRDMRTCYETAVQIKHLASHATTELHIERLECIEKYKLWPHLKPKATKPPTTK